MELHMPLTESHEMPFLCDSEQQYEEQKQQLELMDCIASSVARLAAAASGALQSLARNQETLNNILMHLVNK
jgi:hypothetical protein